MQRRETFLRRQSFGSSGFSVGFFGSLWVLGVLLGISVELVVELEWSGSGGGGDGGGGGAIVSDFNMALTKCKAPCLMQRHKLFALWAIFHWLRAEEMSERGWGWSVEEIVDRESLPICSSMRFIRRDALFRSGAPGGRDMCIRDLGLNFPSAAGCGAGAGGICPFAAVWIR